MYMEELCDEVIRDPYPCAEKTQDSELWLNLLLKAKRIDMELFCMLMYIRGTGAILKVDVQYGYFIEPIIEGNGKTGWLSMKQYNEEKKCLVPYAKTVIKLLREL